MATSKAEIRKPTDSPKKEISYFVVFGDSLSDGKNMGEKFSFLGSLVNGLWKKTLTLDKSPKERFTNGYTWADVLRATLISKFINEDKIKKDTEHRFGKYNLNNADISDDILNQSPYQRKRYTSDEVQAELNEVERKKHTEDREEAHLFAAKRDNTPEITEKPRFALDNADLADAAITRRYKKNGQPPLQEKRSSKASLRESSDDISDKLISDPRYRQYVQEYYSLDNGRTAQYNGRNFFANYSQGGATSYNYKWSFDFLSFFSPLTAIKLFFTRLLVSNLSEQVKQFLEDNEKQEITDGQKEKTLITVFSGANDLITANSDLTEEAAERAAQSNIENIEKLIKQGYTNFVLCNLPDLSLTPRFQKKTPTEREHASKISKHFNTQLKEKYEALQKEHPECSIDLFNINEVFGTVYEDVRQNGENSKYHEYFDQTKLTEPYIDSPEYKLNPNGTSPGAKHMFWDDVHPTATMHALLMSEYYKSKEGLGKYKLSAPREQTAAQLCKQFNQKYHEKLDHGWFSFLNSNARLRIDYKNPEKALITILRYALDEQNEDADFVREAMSDLGWWVNDEPNMCIPALSDAMWIVDPKYARELEKQLDPHLAKLDSSGVMLSAMKTQEVEEQLNPQLAKRDSSGVKPRALQAPEDDKKPQPRRLPPELTFTPDVKERLKKLQDRWDKEKEVAQSKQESLTIPTL
ncbi:SGNH/GDSL hydrolase family protein [Legionella sp. WA2022007384]